MKSPVALFLYKRHYCLRHVWTAIRAARPPVLLLVADGPRSEQEEGACEICRAMVAEVDWPCEVKQNYSRVNMGCRDRIASGLNWVFEQVEEAIILEDDCIPDPSFFVFCDVLLEYYRDDERVMHISGNNFQQRSGFAPWSYYFSKYPHCWGWATWRRAWKHFDRFIATWAYRKDAGILYVMGHGSRLEQRFWVQVFDRQHQRRNNSWAYAWTYCCWAQNGLSILPCVNLVTNVGTGEDSTHRQDDSWFMNLPVGKILEITHPPIMVRNSEADQNTFRSVFKPSLKVRMRETVFNPWFYGKVIRRLPVVGLCWKRWRDNVKQ